MKIKVYKLYFFCDDSAETKRYIFEQIEILSEKGLRERFKQAIQDEQFNCGTFERFDLTKSDAFTIDEIIQIFEYDGYTIEENEIEI